MKGTRRVFVLTAVAVFTAIISSPGGPVASAPGPIANNVLAREFAIENGQASLRATAKQTKSLQGVSGGVMQALRENVDSLASLSTARTSANKSDRGSALVPPSQAGSQGCPNVFKAQGGGNNGDRNSDGNDKNTASRVDNIRVNQDCTLRRQAEEIVGVNPTNSSNVIAGQNDSRIGFNHCGFDWSLDRAKTWGDTGTAPPPFWQELLNDNHTADACSDPMVTFDNLGNVYVGAVIFDVASAANAVVVSKSNTPIDGRFYHTPKNLPFQEYRTSPLGKPASDNDPNIFHDKPLMIADSRATSPKKGRVYVTWTRFETNNTATGGRSPIVFSQSLDGGDTWSRAVIISGTAGAFCTDFSGTEDSPNACDQDQGSDPVVGPDGTIYVIFNNGNTPELGINQVFMVKCPATKSCENESDWLGPFRVGDSIGTSPIGPSDEGCPGGRQCLPPNGYRMGPETTMTISVDKNANLYATWSDFRNGRSPCTPLSSAATAKPPCDNDVFFAYSTNGGTTWSATINVTPRSRIGESAQWQPWSDVTGDGSKLQVAFYDRQYGNCEFTGCNDITLATISNPRSANRSISYQRITTSSMPNLTTANNPIQAGFLGDYMWVEVSRHNFDQRATHIVWADTRPLFGAAPEEDVYYARVDDDRKNGD